MSSSKCLTTHHCSIRNITMQEAIDIYFEVVTKGIMIVYSPLASFPGHVAWE